MPHAANDENARALKPVNGATQHRPGFGFKAKKEAVSTSANNTVLTETEEPVELLKVYDAEIGDLELVNSALKLKTVSGRYEFKAQIEELKGFINPHRAALTDVETRTASLRGRLQQEENEINRRFESFDTKMADKSHVHEEELAKVHEKHAKEVRSWKVKEDDAERFRKQQADNKDREFAEREKQKQLVHGSRLFDLESQVEDAVAKGKLELDDAAKAHNKGVLELEEQVRAAKENGSKELSENAEMHKQALSELHEQVQNIRDDHKEQLEDKARLLQAQISNAEREKEQLLLKAKESEASTVAEWSKNVEDLQRREQELKAEQQASLAQEQLDAAQRESDLRAELADASAQSSAAAQAQQQEFASKLKSQEDLAQKQREQIRATLEKTINDERARYEQQEEGWTSQIEQFRDEVKARERTREETYMAQVRELEALARNNEKHLADDAARTLDEVRRSAQQREADLTKRNEQLVLKSKQLEEELNHELESATESSKRREDELSSQLKQATSKGKQLQEDLMSTCRQRDSQQQELAEVRCSSQQCEADLNRQNKQLALKAKQLEKELNEELESAAECSKRREEDLNSQLKLAVSKSKQLQEELKSTCHRMDTQEQLSRLEIDVASTRQIALEGEIANEKQARSREAMAAATLQAEHTTTLRHVDDQREMCTELQRTYANSQAAAKELQRDLSVSVAECDRLREALAEEQARLQKQRAELEGVNSHYAKTQIDCVTAQAELSSSQSTCERVCREKRDLELEYRSFREHNTSSSQVQVQAIFDLRLSVEKLTEKVDCQQGEISNKANDIVTHQLGMRKLEEQLAHAELSRRELHNTIQELKGNIRVMCRVRPANDPDEPCALTQTSDTKMSLSHGTEVYPYTFDHVFGTESKQEQLFDEVSGLIQSALDGYKVCIFAYGQTGSGKTYTMQGKLEQDNWGLIPRSLRQIFREAEVMRSKGWQWTLKASFIEVYNEVLRDLLREDATVGPQCHTIKHDADWGMVVTNATCIEVTGMNHINSLMAKAAKMRAVGSTDMNAQSSRSHSIFALYLTGVHRELNSELHGALHLVDLAGSERLDKSGAVGERLRETQNINKSLSSLADVFTAKAENRSHVPFRNSKLTHLMEPCLSGQGKTLMFVNVGPEADNSHETWCSLRFAGQVSQCTTGGKPRRAAKTPSRPPSASASSSGLAPSGTTTKRR